MNKQKYSKLLNTFEQIKTKKDAVDLLAALKTVLDEATETDGTIKIVIERNKQVLNIPARLLKDYIKDRKTEIEVEGDALLDTVTVV